MVFLFLNYHSDARSIKHQIQIASLLYNFLNKPGVLTKQDKNIQLLCFF